MKPKNEKAKVTTIRACGKKLLAPIGADGDSKGASLLLRVQGSALLVRSLSARMGGLQKIRL